MKGLVAAFWRSCVLVCVWIYGVSWVHGAAPFEEGNRFFREGKFIEAEQSYKSELDTSGDSAAVRYNLGRVREALGDPGGAMLEWERALRLKPEHQPSIEALELTRRSVGASIHPRKWWATTPLWCRGLEIWIIAFGAWGCLLAGLFGWQRRWRSVSLATVFASGVLLCAGILWRWTSSWASQEAIVRERVATARKAPADPAQALGEYPAGTMVRVIRSSAGWSRCILPDGTHGWIISSAVERISAGQ